MWSNFFHLCALPGSNSDCNLQPVEKQRLYKEGVQLGGESATLANLKIEADDELVLTFQNGGEQTMLPVAHNML